MNKKVYSFLLSTYGRRPGVWFAITAEVIRTVINRVVSVIMLSSLVSDIARADIEGAQRTVLMWVSLAVLSIFIAGVGDYVGLLSENAQYNQLAIDYYRRLTRKDMSFYRDNHTGYLTSMYRQYLDSAMQMVRLIRMDIIRNIISIVFPAIVIWTHAWRIGLLVTLLVIFQLIYMFWATGHTSKFMQEAHEIYRRISGEVADDLTNITAYKASGTEDAASARVEQLINQETKSFEKRRGSVIFYDVPRNIITTCLVGLAFWMAVHQTGGQSEIVGLVVLTITYMFQILRNVADIPDFIVKHDDLITKLAPTLETLNASHETIQDQKSPVKLSKQQRSVELKNVCFAYGDEDSKHIFKDLNLSIKAGEKVGIVGLSGAGKSTLASLLMRFDDIQSGQILIGDTDIKMVAQSDLRAHIAYVPQEPILFHRTIRENIAYQNNNATDEQVISAAKAAHAHDFISDLPKQYDTLAGERGVKLSGGQKQRRVIARAVLKKAPIILFDEATSALDSESEHIIQPAFPQIIGTHTAVIIAHRLSTVAGLDRIIVMHDGTIIEQGTHKQLLATRGRYYSLWKRQTHQHTT